MTSTTQVKLPYLTNHGIYAGKFKDWSPEQRAVSIIININLNAGVT